jgi:HEAT repeat protein
LQVSTIAFRRDSLKDFDAFLLEFAKTAKAISFYPENHPTLINALKKTAADINDFSRMENLVIQIDREAITTKNTRIAAANPVLREFIQTLVLRRVSKIVFNQGVEADELYKFFQFLNMEIGNIFSAGGLEILLENSEIRNIALSELQLKKLLSIRKAPAEKDEMQDLLVTGEGKYDMAPQIDKKEGVQAKSPTGGISGEQQNKLTAKEIWEKLKAEMDYAKKMNDVGRYLSVTKNIHNFINSLNWAEDFDITIDVCLTMMDDRNSYDVLEGIRKEAGNFVFDHLGDNRIGILLDTMLERYTDDDRVKKISSIFKFAGQPAVEVMLERLSSASDIKMRKLLITEITNIGDEAFKRVIFHLADERWFVVRNMVTILGIFSRPDALNKLFETASHPDTRVRKEVVKTLARIQDPRAFVFLREMLQKESDDVKQLIIFSLGIMKDSDSISAIEKMLEGNSSLAIKKEVLMALGRIGGEMVFPIIKKYAVKKGFFSKAEHKVLRIAAINGFVEIKTEEASKILEKLVRDADPDVRDAAFESLQKIKYTVRG